MACSVASTIFEFLEDTSRTFLKLPQMSSGQRKSVKKLIQQHPELRCESYGFGAERQLHLFKVCESEAKQEEVDKSDLMRSLEVMQAMVQVRNTFIHIDENTPVDSRIIQSLPRNMFRQSILTESSKVNLANCAPEVESEERPKDVAPEAKPYPSLSPGSFVVIEGLVKLSAFNGQSAVVQGWDVVAGRYDILLVSTGGCQHAKIKEENLRLALPYCQA